MSRFVLAALALLPLTASAVELADGKLTLNGLGSWSYFKTDGNTYYGDEDGDFQTAKFHLLLNARPAENLVLAVQAGFEERETMLQWAFAEWRVSDALRLRGGKVKQPVGNYGELQQVGTARPFQELATVVYGPANVVGEGVWGVGATGTFALAASWSLQYDLYAGAVELKTTEPFEFLETGAPAPTAPPEVNLELVENILGGRLSLTTPGDLTFRLSGYGGHVSKDESKDLTFLVLGASAWYRGERLWLSAEGFRSEERGFETLTSAYLEVAWFVTERLQAAARYEWSRTDLDGLSETTTYQRHDEVAVGLNWWFTPEVVARLSYSFVDGNRFASGEFDEAAAVYTPPTADTQLLVAGVQFSF